MATHEHLPMTIRAAMSGERRSSALTVAVPVAATASLPGSERFESPLPRSAIGPQILSEHKNNYHASFGHEKRACAASHVSAAAAAARSASSPRERRSPPQASERVPSSVYDLESYSPTQGGAKPAHGGGVGGPHVARHPSPAGVHGHADSSASSPLGGSPISGKSRKLNLPKFYSQRQGITPWPSCRRPSSRRSTPRLTPRRPRGELTRRGSRPRPHSGPRVACAQRLARWASWQRRRNGTKRRRLSRATPIASVCSSPPQNTSTISSAY